MSINYTVQLVDRPVVRDFIEQHHYSHNINGLMSSYCFAMYDQQQQMVGAMIYGKLGMANAWKKYGNSIDEVMELRRLVLVDDTPKNSESYFIGRTLRWLKAHTAVTTIVVYKKSIPFIKWGGNWQAIMADDKPTAAEMGTTRRRVLRWGYGND